MMFENIHRALNATKNRAETICNSFFIKPDFCGTATGGDMSEFHHRALSPSSVFVGGGGTEASAVMISVVEPNPGSVEASGSEHLTSGGLKAAST